MKTRFKRKYSKKRLRIRNNAWNSTWRRKKRTNTWSTLPSWTYSSWGNSWIRVLTRWKWWCTKRWRTYKTRRSSCRRRSIFYSGNSQMCGSWSATPARRARTTRTRMCPCVNSCRLYRPSSSISAARLKRRNAGRRPFRRTCRTHRKKWKSSRRSRLRRRRAFSRQRRNTPWSLRPSRTKKRRLKYYIYFIIWIHIYIFFWMVYFF